MTCHEFLAKLVDLARPKSPADISGDDTAHEVLRNAVRHAEECATCGERLAEARNLSLRLQMVSSSVAVPKSQIQQELALRAAFRARQNVVTIPTELPSSPWKPWTIAIAAMLLATVAGTVALQRASNWFDSESPAMTATPAITATISAGAPMEPARRESVQATIPSAPPNREPVVQQFDGQITTPITERTAEKVAAQAPIRPLIHASTNELSNVAAPALAEKQPLIAAAVENSEQQITFSSAQYETVSEFIPLLYGGDPMLSGSGPVVRVEMSGAALQTLGFPLVEEPSARRVKADLMLGEDGLARAIRFVQ